MNWAWTSGDVWVRFTGLLWTLIYFRAAWPRFRETATPWSGPPSAASSPLSSIRSSLETGIKSQTNVPYPFILAFWPIGPVAVAGFKSVPFDWKSSSLLPVPYPKPIILSMRWYNSNECLYSTNWLKMTRNRCGTVLDSF